ncbi:trigger factor-like [Hydra vulgaris]|uniref:trigger factor-like n=1 Tax=Hydra vulgaris TaxID=6087 RepID=UPI0032E9D644
MHNCVIDAIDNDYNRSYLKICRVITLFFQVNPEEKFNPLTKKMEEIYANVNKAIYKYGKPENDQKNEQVKPYEALFVDANSLFNLKNIDIIDEKEDYEMMDDDDEDDYNNDTDDDDDVYNDDNDVYYNNDDNYYNNNDDKDEEPMEIDNITI